MKKCVWSWFVCATLMLFAESSMLAQNGPTMGWSSWNTYGVNINENLIKRIDYFFFPYGTDGTVDPNAEYVYKGSVVPETGHDR